MSNYENSGNLFSANQMQVFRAGKVDIDGLDHELAIIEVTKKNGEKMYVAFKEVGILNINRNKTEQKDWDISGEIEIDGSKHMSWGRKRFDKNNNAYTRMSFAEAKPKEPVQQAVTPPQQPPIQEQKSDFDDDIPF